MRRPAQLPDPIPSLGEFEGIINAKRKKDFGYGGLAVARNVEVTDTKKLVRRNGFTSKVVGAFSGVYGSINQQQLIAVKDGDLISLRSDATYDTLTTGLTDGTYSWDEDPANSIYYTNDRGSNGIVLASNEWLPLALATPTITSLAVVTTAPWTVTLFNLGKRYTDNVMQVFATYVYDDGRESAPGSVVTVPIAPEVSLLAAVIPVQAGAQTFVYATAPGGSTYWHVASTRVSSFTFPVHFLTQSYTGDDYPYTTALESFPSDANLLAFYAGRLYAALFDAPSGLGAIYPSLPLQYHLFDKSEDLIAVAGPPLLMLACKDGLIIGTDVAIYLLREADGKSKLEQVANYGVPPGVCGDVDMNGTAHFWTLRGVAKAAPYSLVTEHKFSGDPGVFNNARIFYERGYAKLVASTITGAPTFNKWTERT